MGSSLKMTRRDEYLQYLKSTDWKEQRVVALERTSGFCQYCGGVASQVHHVKYPKQFGEEHPHSLIPVCERCHNISHGVQKMEPLSNVEILNEISPNGARLNYLLSGMRVYASAKSWARALQIPDTLHGWFETGLARIAIIKKDLAGGSLEMSFQNKTVYRWPAVAEQLRVFDREWHKNQQFRGSSKLEQKELQQFYENYDRLVSWGYDLQERALSSSLNVTNDRKAPVTQEALIETVKQAVAPRLHAHDEKLHEHDIVIEELKEATPMFRDKDEFITVKQAVSEQALDSNLMPRYPHSRETLPGLAGQMLKEKGVEQGESEITRLDGQSISTEVRTYRRRDIYEVLAQIVQNKQRGLPL